MRRQRTSHRDFDTNRGIPIYDDVVRGSGGLYLFTNDTVDPTNIENSGTAQAGAETTITLASAASATNDAYNGMSLQITSGTGSGQDHQRITDYDGTTKEATVSGAWTTTPDSTSVYRIVNRGA